MKDENWYVLMTKPGKQDDVALRLIKAGFEVFNPKLRQYNTKLAKYKIVHLFPLYLFIKIQIKEHHRTIKYTRGVLKFIGPNNQPSILSEQIIDKIRTNCNTENIIEARYTEEQILPGDKVIIADGPLKGIEAIVSGLCNEQKRVEILLDLMKITINKGELKKI